MRHLKSVLHWLKDSNYLTGKCIAHNEKIQCDLSLLKNGLKLREQLLKQWLLMSNTWSTQCDKVQQIDQNIIENDNRTSFVQRSEFTKSYQDVLKKNLVKLSSSIALKTIYNNVVYNFVSEHNLFYGSKVKTLLVTYFFVAEENELSKYNNLQRERKIWWMRFSSNPSRYSVEQYDLRTKKGAYDKILTNSKSVTITANFQYGLVDMETISLVPLYKLRSENSSPRGNSSNISVIRSVIDLDVTASALILDASVCQMENSKHTLALNRKLAPYQVLLANLHQGNKTVDELTLHLQYVISKTGLRLYGSIICTNSLTELEEQVIQFDCLGIPYTILIDEESSRSGLIKMRSRDTTLFEIIHISDIPHCLLKIFNSN